METLEGKIKEFLTIISGDGDGHGSGNGYGHGSGCGSGNGYGDGSGCGSGYGSGSGNGYGDGDGCGSGYGSGSGNGYGDGDGLKSLNNRKIYLIDSVETIITSVKNNIAKGFIVNSDLTLKPCYIAKGENIFAHGDTLQKAVDSLREKLLINKPIEERIAEFKEVFSSVTKKYEASLFYQWHYLLTGSCDMGRRSFIENKGILLTDKFTVTYFILLVENSYGSEIIKQLKESYQITNKVI